MNECEREFEGVIKTEYFCCYVGVGALPFPSRRAESVVEGIERVKYPEARIVYVLYVLASPKFILGSET
jgi:hypothetical protein